MKIKEKLLNPDTWKEPGTWLLLFNVSALVLVLCLMVETIRLSIDTRRIYEEIGYSTYGTKKCIDI